MAELVTLAHFGGTQRHYHIYRLRSSKVAHLSHYHDYFQICFAVSGTVLHRQGSEEVSLCAGDAFIVPPGFIHSLHFGKTAEIYSLSFDRTLFHAGFSHSNAHSFLTYLQKSAEEGDLRLRVMLDGERYKSAHSILECLLRQQKEELPAELSAVPSLIAALLYLLAQVYYRQDPVPGNTGAQMLQCLEYINDHYKEELSLSELAKHFGMSRSAFCTVFPRIAGMPLHQYVADKRVTEAQMLIRTKPAWKLSQIAAEVGYHDDSTFYRNFVKITGISPAQYRKRWENRK